jgi:hypothetical protein
MVSAITLLEGGVLDFDATSLCLFLSLDLVLYLKRIGAN